MVIHLPPPSLLLAALLALLALVRTLLAFLRTWATGRGDGMVRIAGSIESGNINGLDHTSGKLGFLNHIIAHRPVRRQLLAVPGREDTDR